MASLKLAVPSRASGMLRPTSVSPHVQVVRPCFPVVFNRAPGVQSSPKLRRKLIVRSAAEIPKDLKDLEKIKSRVEEASKSIQDAAAKLDLTQLVRYNFFAQLVLAATSWGIMFITTHSTIAAGAKVGVGTIILMVGTLLSGYSAFLSYGYFSKVQSGGASVLAGWARMSSFYHHITFNFIGAAAAVVALQATVGSQVMSTLASSAMSAVHLSKASAGSSSLGLQFLMQAASNTLLAHIVSILFLVLLLKKTTDAYEPMIEMTEKFKAAMSV